MFRDDITMSAKEWDRAKKMMQDRDDTINVLKADLKDTTDNNILNAKKASKLARENAALEIELTKLKLQLKNEEASLTTVLGNLNECFTIMERHGLSTRSNRVKAIDLLA